jgi:hypothetical protein
VKIFKKTHDYSYELTWGVVVPEIYKEFIEKKDGAYFYTNELMGVENKLISREEATKIIGEENE